MATLEQMIINVDMTGAIAEVEAKLEAGENALDVLGECMNGMTKVGELFQTGELFLAELVLSGEIFKEALKILSPKLAEGQSGEKKGKFMIATLKGDIHYLGKNIVATLMEAHGFDVLDMGEDVDPKLFVEKMKEFKPDFVGFSSLLTPNMEEMKAAVDLMKEEGLRDGVKVLIGGGITSEISKNFVGADFQTTDAMAGVSYCCDLVDCK